MGGAANGQVGYGPLWRVDGPPPIRPVFGLLAAAEAPAAGVRIVTDVGDDEVERWGNGIEVYPYPPDVPDVFDPCSFSSVAAPMGFGSGLNHPQFGPMTVHIDETCTSYRIWDQDEFAQRAAVVFAAVESFGVASELLTGTRMPANPHLADGTGVFPLGAGAAAVSCGVGLSILEDVISAFGRLGLIHMSEGTATGMREKFALSDKSGVLRTINGNVIIPDMGYTQWEPTANGGAGGYVAVNPQIGGARGAVMPYQEWIYATGPIDIRRSELILAPDNVREALDRGMAATNNKPNSITYRAMRYYVVSYDTEMKAAVLIDRTL